jgi:hypothetical protein
MNPTRRGFLKMTGAGGLILCTGGASMLLEGCPPASTIFADIVAWIPTAKNAFKGILTILGPFLPAGAQVLADAVFASLDTVAAAVAEYNAAPAAAKATALGKIRVVLQVVADNIQTFLNDFNLTGNPIIAVVIGLAEVILSTIAGFIGQLPIAGHKVGLGRTSVTFSGVSKPIVPKMRTLKQFRNDYNAVTEANGQSQIDI